MRDWEGIWLQGQNGEEKADQESYSWILRRFCKTQAEKYFAHSPVCNKHVQKERYLLNQPGNDQDGIRTEEKMPTNPRGEQLKADLKDGEEEHSSSY